MKIVQPFETVETGKLAQCIQDFLEEPFLVIGDLLGKQRLSLIGIPVHRSTIQTFGGVNHHVEGGILKSLDIQLDHPLSASDIPFIVTLITTDCRIAGELQFLVHLFQKILARILMISVRQHLIEKHIADNSVFIRGHISSVCLQR